MKKTDLNRIDSGQKHSQNPLGGVPMGKGQNGRTNTVEQGETTMGDFVFSDTVKLTKETIKEFNLPPNLEGKTVAQATKIIDNKFKDRQDAISTSTKTKMLDGVAMAQESIKAKQAELSQAFEANSTEVPDMMNGEIPKGMEQFIQNKMFLGGFGGQNTTGTDNNQAFMQGLGAMGAGMSRNNNLSNTPMSSQEQTNSNMWEGTKDSVAGAFPILGLFRGAEKAGKGLGQSIGGDKGGDFATGFLDPVTTVTSKDTNFGEKTLSLLDPVASGIILANKNKHRREEAARNQHIIDSNTTLTNDFALGGSTREPVTSVFDNPMFNDYNTSNKLASDYYFNNLSTPKGNMINSYPTSTFENNTYSKANLKPVADWTKNNYGDIMRYSPVVANALQLRNLDKPNAVRLNKLDNRFVPDYVDEKSIQNIIGNETDNTINALTNATNGSMGTLRNSILGASINRTKGLSDAYLNASAQNRAQRLQGQDFNRSTDQFNIGQANQELDINDRNTAAYDTNKSRLISAIGENLGDIGKEEVYKKLARQTYGYTWDGRYWVKPDGSKATDEQVKQEIQSNTNQSKLGGMLFKNRK